ncbi:MAG: ATP-binding protein [Campylobacterales bacterium]
MNAEEKLKVLWQFGASVSAERDINKLMDFLAATVTQLIGAERCSIFLYDREKNELWTTYAQGVDGTIRLPADKGIVGHALISEEIQAVVDAYNDFRFHKEVDQQTGYCTRNILAAPLFDSGGDVMGVMEVLNKSDACFNVDDLSALQLFGNFVAYALQNKLLQERIAEATQKQIQQERLAAQRAKMAEVGEIMGMIAHQWKQPLSALSLNLQNIREESEQEDLKTEIDRALAQTAFMAATVDDFRNFLRPDRTRRSFDPYAAAESVAQLFGPLFAAQGAEIRCQQRCTHQPKATGYENEFKQVILNLLNNAREAIESRRIKNGLIRLEANCQEGWTAIEIQDNAGGIEPEAMARIFEAWFTTKGREGTGIGLSMSRMIVESMNGTLEAENTAAGALFRLKLPVTP